MAHYKVWTVSLEGAGFAGYNEVRCAKERKTTGGRRFTKPLEPENTWAHDAAKEAARRAFASSGAFPGYRRMVARVRVHDDGRAVVCQSKDRLGW